MIGQTSKALSNFKGRDVQRKYEKWLVFILPWRREHPYLSFSGVGRDCERLVIDFLGPGFWCLTLIGSTFGDLCPPAPPKCMRARKVACALLRMQAWSFKTQNCRIRHDSRASAKPTSAHFPARENLSAIRCVPPMLCEPTEMVRQLY